VETTIISMKGEEKSRKQQRCYTARMGEIQKLHRLSQATAPAKERRRRRGGGKVRRPS
jgi:hypothetical protein